MCVYDFNQFNNRKQGIPVQGFLIMGKLALQNLLWGHDQFAEAYLK